LLALTSSVRPFAVRGEEDVGAGPPAACLQQPRPSLRGGAGENLLTDGRHPVAFTWTSISFHVRARNRTFGASRRRRLLTRSSHVLCPSPVMASLAFVR